MKATYRLLAQVIALGVVFQAAVLAFAWFTVINEVDSGAVIDQNYEGNVGHMLHGTVGMMLMPLLGLLLLIVSFFAKIPGGVKWAGFVLLAIVVQVVLAIVAFGIPAVGALHGINAIVVFGLAFVAARRVRAQAPPARVEESSAGATAAV